MLAILILLAIHSVQPKPTSLQTITQYVLKKQQQKCYSLEEIETTVQELCEKKCILELEQKQYQIFRSSQPFRFQTKPNRNTCCVPSCTAALEQTQYCAAHLESLFQLEIKPSTIPNAGKGLFTTAARKRKEQITDYSGDIVFDAHLVNRWEFGGDYVIDINGDFIIDAHNIQSCAGRFINDIQTVNRKQNSDLKKAKTNCKFITNKQDMFQVDIVCTREMKKGDEFFIDYGTTYW